MRKLTILTMFLVIAALSASAATLSDSLTVYTPTGSILYQLLLFEDGSFNGGACSGPTCGVAEDPLNIYYLLDSSIIDPTQFGNATVLRELDGTDSDIFGIATLQAGLFNLAFSSDSETSGVNFGSFPRTFPEGNGTFDATLYLDPTLQAGGYTAVFTSDAVPEPSTVVLLAFGLVALGVRRIRK